jgi:pimeloyl-ACP methyl ester carboxylesterase
MRFFRLAALLLFPALFASNPLRAADPAPSQQPTYVLVHGAWGGGWAFKEVDRLLTAQGGKVYRPTLTGQGERCHLANPGIDLSTHITDVVNLILWEDLHDVILMGHSYGGMVITGVIDRIPDRIARVVYLDALLPVDGESAEKILHMDLSTFNIVNGGIVPPWVTDPAAPPPHDVPHPLQTFKEPIHLVNQAKVAKIPTTYILTVDPGRKPEQDDFYACYLRAKARGWECLLMEGDHNVQWSHPGELADLIRTSKGLPAKK